MNTGGGYQFDWDITTIDAEPYAPSKRWRSYLEARPKGVVLPKCGSATPRLEILRNSPARSLGPPSFAGSCGGRDAPTRGIEPTRTPPSCVTSLTHRPSPGAPFFPPRGHLARRALAAALRRGARVPQRVPRERLCARLLLQRRQRARPHELRAPVRDDLAVVRCNAMQCKAMQNAKCNAMQCNAMQCNATQCNAMQCKCNAMQCNSMQCNAMQCNAMQCNAMQCNAMQCNAMQCNAMQCSAVQCNVTYGLCNA